MTARNLLLALGCAACFYLVLDLGLDPMLDRLFPQSGAAYEEAVEGLKARPWVGLLRVGLAAPVIEELLMRGLLLRWLKGVLPWPLALVLSAGVFAVLHFNLNQGLSALVCGLALGGLYLYTGSLLCCMLAHAAYNCISYFALLGPPR